MKNINNIFKIGTIVKANEWIPIDMNWKPPSWFGTSPDTRGTKVFVSIGDHLTIISEAINPPNHWTKSYLFKVQDKDGNEFYLSAEWFDIADEKEECQCCGMHKG
jgi:hypothetical protein